MKLISLFGIAFCLIMGSHATANENIKRGEELSQTCLGCHGSAGFRNASPVYKVPKIGGQHAAYIISALKAYKSKTRSHPTMQAQAASLSDQDMTDIAAYFSALNNKDKIVKKPRAAAGKELAGTCAGCHGISGNEDNDSFPRLAGQYDDYLQRALLDYQSGKRENAIMNGLASSLSKQDIIDLSHWYRSQESNLNQPTKK